MDYLAIPFDAHRKNQTITMVGSPNGNPMHMAFTIRYIEPTGKWFLTVSDAESGDIICKNVTLVGSRNPHDLLKHVGYKGAGSLFCVPKSDKPTSNDPGEFDLDEFEISWGDTYAG